MIPARTSIEVLSYGRHRAYVKSPASPCGSGTIMVATRSRSRPVQRIGAYPVAMLYRAKK
jgi:hypothetical protein